MTSYSEVSAGSLTTFRNRLGFGEELKKMLQGPFKDMLALIARLLSWHLSRFFFLFPYSSSCFVIRSPILKAKAINGPMITNASSFLPPRSRA